jgi:AcrR family transcriptional regulator
MKKLAPVKQRILEAAKHLFYQNGYNSTGINELVANANVAKASLYSHFTTKDDLLLAYLNAKESAFMEDIDDFVQMRVKGRDQVICLFDFLLQRFSEKEFRGSWCVNTLAETPKDHQELRNEIIAYKEHFRQYIKDLVKENINTAEAHGISNKIYLLFEAAFTQSYVHNASWPIMEAKEMAKMLI